MIYELTSVKTEYNLFYYECARLLFKEIECDEKNKMYVIDAVKKFATQDLELWKRWIDKNEHNIKWQRIIGEVLAGLSAEPLIAYAETMNNPGGFEPPVRSK